MGRTHQRMQCTFEKIYENEYFILIYSLQSMQSQTRAMAELVHQNQSYNEPLVVQGDLTTYICKNKKYNPTLPG